ncbi:hypothetical protein GCM10023214_62350 [Amycolatopsis dongchuanensis]|uniref:DUF4145 domain-containing protein n=2 Tax=Pseudonocardiaceae TaxID=2070 RepID=A0ABP8VE51_9PSEU
MFPLDPKTVERVARIVVGRGTPYERTGREVEALLRNSGWIDPPDYDGSAKVGWLVDALVERENARTDIERFLCRLCDPLEYPDGMATADDVRRAVNEVLELERLEVSHVDGRPVVGELGSNGTVKVVLHVEDVEQRLRKLIREEKLIQMLVSRVRESQFAEASGSYLLALFGIGSFVEGLLYSVLTSRYPELAREGFAGRNGKIRADRAGLELLLDTAHDRGLVQLDAKDFMRPVREFRNYIHPRKQFETDFTPDGDTVAMCWTPVQALLNDLDKLIDS